MKKILTSLVVSLSSLSLYQPVTAQATPQTFRDWSVVCDNVKTCMAFSTSSQSEGGLAARPRGISADIGEGWMTITRSAGPATSAQILLSRPSLSDLSLAEGSQIHLVGPNGRLVPRGVFAATLGSRNVIEIPAALNGAFLSVARTATHAILVAGAVKRPVFYVSLSGLVASGRSIDAKQGRTGTVGALIDTGRIVESRVPASPSLPSLTAVAFVKRNNATPSAEIMRKRQAECSDSDRFDPGGSGIEAFDLGAGRTLWSIPCGGGAYNSWNRFYISPSRAPLERANFLRHVTVEGHDDINITNAVLDPAKGLIKSFSKSRGPGDCGSDETYAWNGTDFVLAQSREMVPCGGIVSDYWPSVYQSRIITTAPRRR
jgi:hypothetical protein